jgi:hypothetical protein
MEVSGGAFDRNFYVVKRFEQSAAVERLERLERKAECCYSYNGHVNDLRWSTEEQRSIVEVHILTEDSEIL